MNSTLVYTTSTDAHRRHVTATAGIARVHAAPIRPAPVYGMCRACRCVWVRLHTADGTVNLSHMGKSAAYPTGYGCEVCG